MRPTTLSHTCFFRWLTVLGLAAVTALAGCATRKPHERAPVEDRGTSRPVVPPIVAQAPAEGGAASATSSTPGVSSTSTVGAPRVPLGIENLGRPGYYQVRPSDTLIRIGLESGQSWRDIARWNGLDNPNVIEAGQVLRIIAPGVSAVAAPAGTPAATPVNSSSGVTTSNLPPAGSRTTASGPLPPASSGSDEEVNWVWPASGSVIERFDETKNKGLDIAGKLGDAVLAAGDGRVVYAGSGLRGYGNLIILKHNNTYLTAYAHNQALLVKEDQTVRRGQKIAEMGSSDADKVKLHFEVRRLGKPVDPLRFLPVR